MQVGAAITIGVLLGSIRCPKGKARLMKRISGGDDPAAAGVK